MTSAKNTTEQKKRGPKPGVQREEKNIPQPDTLKPGELAQAIPIGRGRQSEKYSDAIARLMDGEQIAYRSVTDDVKKTVMAGLRQQMKSKNKLPNIHLDLQFGWIESTKTLVVWNKGEEAEALIQE